MTRMMYNDDIIMMMSTHSRFVGPTNKHCIHLFTLCWRQIIDRCRAIVLRLCKCHNLYDIK